MKTPVFIDVQDLVAGDIVGLRGEIVLITFVDSDSKHKSVDVTYRMPGEKMATEFTFSFGHRARLFSGVHEHKDVVSMFDEPMDDDRSALENLRGPVEPLVDAIDMAVEHNEAARATINEMLAQPHINLAPLSPRQALYLMTIRKMGPVRHRSELDCSLREEREQLLEEGYIQIKSPGGPMAQFFCSYTLTPRGQEYLDGLET